MLIARRVNATERSRFIHSPKGRLSFAAQGMWIGQAVRTRLSPATFQRWFFVSLLCWVYIWLYAPSSDHFVADPTLPPRQLKVALFCSTAKLVVERSRWVKGDTFDCQLSAQHVRFAPFATELLSHSSSAAGFCPGWCPHRVKMGEVTSRCPPESAATPRKAAVGIWSWFDLEGASGPAH